MDVDMRIVDKVGDEILGDLVATQHPGMWFKGPDECTYERRPESTAYVPFGDGEKYYAGGFNGGLSTSWKCLRRLLIMLKKIGERFDCCLA